MNLSGLFTLRGFLLSTCHRFFAKGAQTSVSPPLLPTPYEENQKNIHSIIKNILSNDYVFLNFDEICIKEDIRNEKTHITCKVTAQDESFLVDATGDGVVDALFTALLEKFSSSKFLSLEELVLEGFSIEAQFNSKIRKISRTDSAVEARLLVKNGVNTEFIFRHVSASIISAAIYVIKEAFEYFINSELAVEVLYVGISDAQKRNRVDIANNYTSQLSELVKNVCYSSKLVALREELMNGEEN